MPRPGFDAMWQRMKQLEGETFHTKTGLEFAYTIDGAALYPSRTRYRIARADVEKAFMLVPFDGPGKINELVRGPAYVWAILHDPRVRGEVA